MDNEAKARIAINELLKAARWRLNGDNNDNVELEYEVTITETEAEAYGNETEEQSKGYTEYLLLNEKGFPLLVLEAKSTEKKYYRSLNGYGC